MTSPDIECEDYANIGEIRHLRVKGTWQEIKDCNLIRIHWAFRSEMEAPGDLRGPVAREIQLFLALARVAQSQDREVGRHDT